MIVGREDVHPGIAGGGGQGDGAAVGAIDREGILRVRIAVGIMGIIFEVAVDIAGLEAELHIVGEAMRDRSAALERAAGIAVPAGLADEGVAIELLAGDRIGTEGADDRKELSSEEHTSELQ